MRTKVIPAVMAVLLLAIGFSSAHADGNEKLEFAGHLEETLGHFWAIEKNLDDHNAELALVHATHPIAELYDLMKPDLKAANPDFDAKIQQTLMDLGKKTGKDVTREDAQKALDDATEIIEEARTIIVGKDLSQDPNFKMQLMQGLLETSKGEYEEGVANGQINLMAEFQDGSAFVWRSQQIFNEIKGDLSENDADEIEKSYTALWSAYDKRADPSEIATLADGIIDKINTITGEQSEDNRLEVYFENIEQLLSETKEKYAHGMTDDALSLATKAYLDNYEYLESPIGAKDKALMSDIEIMMREDLRNMIKTGSPSDQVNSHIGTILTKLDKAEGLVMASMDEEENEQDYEGMPPLKQIKAGVEPDDVRCNPGMELVIKNSNGSPACVSSNTAERLIQLGWGSRPQ